MSTISIPLPSNLEEFIDRSVKSGYAPTKAEVVRKALRFLAEEMAVRDVLDAQKEVSEGKILRGNIRDLLEKI
jgi:putative addiction module CopG family antidote